MAGAGFVVEPEQLGTQAGTIGDLADRCTAAGRALAGITVAAGAFGTTRHGPVIARLCAQFRATVGDRMTSAGESGDELSSAVRRAAGTYRTTDQLVAGDYAAVAGSAS